MSDLRDIIYLHGFNSDGEGWKTKALRRHFPTASVQAPDLPAHPGEVQEIIEECIHQAATPPLLAGHSLGGFYALHNSALHQLKALLFNPSIEPHRTLAGRGVGRFKTWTQGRDYHFKVEYLNMMETMKQHTDQKITPTLLHFYLAENDEVLDHRPIPALFPSANIQWFPNTGHFFRKFEQVLKQIKKEN